MSKIDYSVLPLAKPSPKRKPDSGRTQHNSTLKSYKDLSPVGQNEKRREEKDGEQAEACRMLPCCVCGSPAPSDPQHTPKRSLGGLDKDCVPMCRRHHDEADGMRHSKFWRRVGLDPEDVKAAVRAWMAAGCPQGALPFGGRR